MIRFAVMAAVGALSAAGAAKALITFEMPRAIQAAQAQPESLRPLRADLGYVAQPSPPLSTGAAASVIKAADGHYWAEGSVNGKRVRFLVDTGASAVALTLDDAHRLGFQNADLDYRFEVSTANGKTRAARVTLDDVSVAGARVAGVDAYVLESGLETSLLGMTYLGRLSRFEATQGALILRP